jgi:hypothetical protein
MPTSEPYPFDDSDEGVSWFSVGVIVVAFVLLTAWGLIASWHQL